MLLVSCKLNNNACLTNASGVRCVFLVTGSCLRDATISCFARNIVFRAVLFGGLVYAGLIRSICCFYAFNHTYYLPLVHSGVSCCRRCQCNFVGGCSNDFIVVYNRCLLLIFLRDFLFVPVLVFSCLWRGRRKCSVPLSSCFLPRFYRLFARNLT